MGRWEDPHPDLITLALGNCCLQAVLLRYPPMELVI
jgi:hypothetical protein